MDYIFGTSGNIETLKTKGDTHTDLTGFRELERRYPDQTITDRFHIVRKIDSQKDAAGNCYDWYEIDQHYRFTDKTGPVAAQLSKAIAAMEDTFCELDAAINQ